jgi:hypothetical protein
MNLDRACAKFRGERQAAVASGDFNKGRELSQCEDILTSLA